MQNSRQSFSRLSTYTSFFDKKPALESLLLGALTGLIFFPIPAIQLVLFWTLSRFLLILDTKYSLKKALGISISFFFGYFFVSLYWICHALTVEIESFWWAIPFCLFGLPLFLSLIPSSILPWFIGWTYKSPHKFLRYLFLQFGQGDDYAVLRLLMLATWIGTFEFLMDEFFPWAAIGNTWVSVSVISQFAAVGGVFTLSFLTVALMGIPYLWMTKTDTKGRLCYAVFGAVSLVGILLYGSLRLKTPVTWSSTKVRLVQPGIPHRIDWKMEEQIQDLNKLFNLSKQNKDYVNAIIWPEAILTLSLDVGSYLPQQIAEFLRDKSDYLITGAVRRTHRRAWNSIYVLNKNGVARAPYDKHHLVPFGEYVPLRLWIEKTFGIQNLRKITAGMLDFSKGSGQKVLDLEGLPSFSPMICYEAIFPGQVVPYNQNPSWLLHVTEDSWFGKSVGPYQHFQISRMRAIEEGVPVVRVANTGISGVIDPYGRVVQKMKLGETGVLDARLPNPLPAPPLARKFYSLMAWIDQKTSLTRLVR